MSDRSQQDRAFRLYTDRPVSELEHFIAFFYNGWNQEFPDFLTAAYTYIEHLSKQQKQDLKRELIHFAESRKSSKALKKSWLKMGAGWPKDLDIHATLRHLIDLL